MVENPPAQVKLVVKLKQPRLNFMTPHPQQTPPSRTRKRPIEENSAPACQGKMSQDRKLPENRPNTTPPPQKTPKIAPIFTKMGSNKSKIQPKNDENLAPACQNPPPKIQVTPPTPEKSSYTPSLNQVKPKLAPIFNRKAGKIKNQHPLQPTAENSAPACQNRQELHPEIEITPPTPEKSENLDRKMARIIHLSEKNKETHPPTPSKNSKKTTEINPKSNNQDQKDEK